MKWMLAIVAVVAVLLIVAALVGSTRPKDHVATLTATLPANDSTVWALLHQDISGYESRTRITASVERRTLIREVLPGQGYSGSWTYELLPEGPGTRLTITERGHVDNPLFRFFMVFNDTGKTMRKYVSALEAKLPH
jgi:hypothetical protein